jgi:UDP-glucose 4-epimerase
MMQKYDLIVTGAKGNIGSSLLKKHPGNNLAVSREDWELIENIKIEANAVIHCAFDLKHTYADNPTAMIDSNILSTAKLLEFVKKNNIKKFIFISSCAVYGHSSNTTEKNQCIPISINGNVKLINEYFIQEFCLKNNIKYHIFRVFNLFGGDDHFSVISLLLKCIKTDQAFIINNDGVSQRDFVHIDDVCDILLETVEKNLDFNIVNVGTGRSTQIKDLVDLVLKIKPNLKTIKKNNLEIEYSRANLDYFKTIFKKDFVNVYDVLKRELNILSQSEEL